MQGIRYAAEDEKCSNSALDSLVIVLLNIFAPSTAWYTRATSSENLQSVLRIHLDDSSEIRKFSSRREASGHLTMQLDPSER